MSSQFNKVYTNNIAPSKLSSSKLTKEKKIDISRILSLISLRPSKSILAKSKFYNKNPLLSSNSISNIKLYTQVSKGDISKIIKIKEPSSNKVLEVHKVINKSDIKGKPKFNITTKSSSHKQIIILMSINNAEKIIIQASKHVKNINRLLKSIKSEIVADYIWSDNKSIIVTTNKVVASSDLNIVEKYIKNLNNIDSSNVLKLPQLKSCFKIF